MPPVPGTIHRVPRRDSGAARMWRWAAGRRKPWSTIDLGEAVGGSPRRIRAIVAGWREAGLVEELRPAEKQPDGSQGAALYRVADAHHGAPPPVMVVRDGSIVGARQGSPAAVEKLKATIAALGMSVRAAAIALDIDRRALVRMMAGETLVADDDPVMIRLAALARERLAALQRVATP
jgi:hypothetical protein